MTVTVLLIVLVCLQCLVLVYTLATQSVYNKIITTAASVVWFDVVVECLTTPFYAQNLSNEVNVYSCLLLVYRDREGQAKL